MEYDIYCPVHHKDERLNFPDSPKSFEGEVECSPAQGETPAKLKARIIYGYLVDVDPIEGAH